LPATGGWYIATSPGSIFLSSFSNPIVVRCTVSPFTVHSKQQEVAPWNCNPFIVFQRIQSTAQHRTTPHHGRVLQPQPNERRQEYQDYLPLTERVEEQLRGDVEELTAQEGWDAETRNGVEEWLRDRDNIWRALRVSAGIVSCPSQVC
jgi:hypothetical protein